MMMYAPPWPHVSVSEGPTVSELGAMLILWNVDRPHRMLVAVVGGTTDFPHPGFDARCCPCGTAFIIARDVFEAYCGGHTCTWSAL